MHRLLRDHVDPVDAAWRAATVSDASDAWRQLVGAADELGRFAAAVADAAAARAEACRTVEQDVADVLAALEGLWRPPAEQGDVPVSTDLEQVDDLVAAVAAAVDDDRTRPGDAARGTAELDRVGAPSTDLLVLTHEDALDDVHVLPDVRVHLTRIG